MSKTTVNRVIRILKGYTDSVHEQVSIAHALRGKGIPPTDGVKKKNVEDHLSLNLDYNPGTSLGHLEEIGLVESYTPPGPEFFAISERVDDVVNGRVDEVAEVDIEALIEHIHDDDPPRSRDSGVAADGGQNTLRAVVADAFDLQNDAVEGFLRTGDPVDKLNESIEAIEDHDLQTRESYGEIYVRRAAFRWQLTQNAIDLYER
jgi:hypothetical protein